MKILFFANTDWYLYNFRLSLAQSLRSAGHDVVLMSPPGEYVTRLEEAGFRWIEFNFSRQGINPLAELNTIAALRRIYQHEKPDLVHHFTIKSVLYGSFAARRAGINAVVNSITGLGYVFSDKFPARVLRQLVKRLYHRALTGTQVIFQNPDDQELFLKLKLVVPQQTTLILGSGVNPDRFSPMTEPDSMPVAVLPARMLWDKGVGEFVRAAQILRGEGLRARFALVGKNDPHNPNSISYDQLCQWQKEGDVEWWGWQDNIASVFAMAHIICLPTSYREGVPRVLIEAAACGKPLIAADVPGCREVVRHEENGLLIPPRDADKLADALRRLIRDRELRLRMGARGRELVLSDFSDDRVFAATRKVYQRVLGRDI